MGFLSFLFNKQNASPEEERIKADITLVAPVEGTLVPIQEVPDIVISERVMGEGVAIIPDRDEICAPCDGVISRLLPTKNAFAIRTEEGVEIYISFGVEAMELKGEGLNLKVRMGDEVKCGQTILQFDKEILASRLKSLITSIIVIKTSAPIDKVVAASGPCEEGKTPILWIALKEI